MTNVPRSFARWMTRFVYNPFRHNFVVPTFGVFIVSLRGMFDLHTTITSAKGLPL